jgi:succinylarginine dihydrolase
MIQAPQNCVVEAKRQSNFGSRRVNVRTNKWKQAQLQQRTCGARMRAWQPSRLPLRTQEAVQRLSAIVVCQNFSNRRRKVIDAGTRHDDTVAAAVSFLSDAQESPAVVLTELHVEMLALNLQFFRLDDVIHFS